MAGMPGPANPPASAAGRRTLLRAAVAVPVTVPVTVALAGCLGQDWADQRDTTLTLATGNPGGVFAKYGAALAEVLEERLDGLTARTRATDASVENLRLVAGGTADVGFSLGDTASDALRGRSGFARPLAVVALTRTYDSFVHLVVRADGGIRSATDLRGRRVGLGAGSSGTRVTAERILARHGLGRRDVRASGGSLQDDVEALAAGRLDAFFFVSGLPNDAIHGLARRVAVRLVPLAAVVDRMVASHGPEYVDGQIPASTYDLPDVVPTVSVKNYVVVSPRMPDDLAYAVTRVVFEEQDRIDRLAPDLRQPNLNAAIFTSPLDLHPGALHYFRERA
jgi:TRAP transporter TAXI family solute receptor